MATKQQVVPSEWGPLHIAVFRMIWFASLAANVGTWFQNVGSVWLMTRFTTSPILIAMMQTATTLPVFLVGIPAGALADIVNRRHLLLATQGLIFCTAAVLSVLTFAGLMNAPLLLSFTFVLGLGAVLSNPAWQAVNAELVPPEELPAAVTLGSVSYNLARAVGPALAGLIIAVAGPAAVFLLNAIAFLYVVVVLSRWHPAPHRAFLPAERLIPAMRAGIRFVSHSPAMQTVLIRTFFFIFFISGLWALLPVIVSQGLHLGASGYGLLLGCMGMGAVAGAAILPQVHRRIPVADQIEYRVIANQAEDFLRAMYDVRSMRERDGAFSWFVAHDPVDEERHIEGFMAESWVAYLRQLERMTNADHAIEDRARSFHQGSAPPTVTTLIAEHAHWKNGS